MSVNVKMSLKILQKKYSLNNSLNHLNYKLIKLGSGISIRHFLISIQHFLQVYLYHCRLNWQN